MPLCDRSLLNRSKGATHHADRSHDPQRRPAGSSALPPYGVFHQPASALRGQRPERTGRNHPKSGVYQAILARPKDERLEIVFGARRYRASLLAGKETIPALVREMSDAEVLEAQLIELSIVGKSFLCIHAARYVVYM
jgi:ParB-like nuclease domain